MELKSQIELEQQLKQLKNQINRLNAVFYHQY